MSKPGKSGKIASVNLSRKRGQVKQPVEKAELICGKGFAGDGHLGFGHRQVSLLMLESITEQKKRLEQAGVESCQENQGKKISLAPGVFAENLTTLGIDLSGICVGEELVVKDRIRLRVSQIGKECHTRCAVYRLVGDCIMPALGIFCEALDSGTVKPGDKIERR